MAPEKNTKEKIISILTVFILFLIVGSLLFSISANNKNTNTALKNKVLNSKIIKEDPSILEGIESAISAPTTITARSFLTLAVTKTGLKKILAEKNSDLPLPIASITKLMVAVITLENVEPNTEIKATRDYIGQEESAYVLETNKTYSIKELLTNMLVSSDNDSARLLGSTLGEKDFIKKMNSKASELKLTNTKYFNLTGLDPKKTNKATVNDLADLLLYIKDKHPEILKLTTNSLYNFCDTKNFCKTVSTTDKFLTNDNFRFKIIGGKTGSTDLALKNLALIMQPKDGIILINIVLGALDSFTDTESLINNLIVIN